MTRIKLYGELWENSLKELWNNPLISLHQIGKKLGMNNIALLQQANRLGLTLPRSDGKLITTKISPTKSILTELR